MLTSIPLHTSFLPFLLGKFHVETQLRNVLTGSTITVDIKVLCFLDSSILDVCLLFIAVGLVV